MGGAQRLRRALLNEKAIAMSNNFLIVNTLIRGRFRLADNADTPRLYTGALPSTTAGLREELLSNTSRQPELLIRFLAEMDRKLDAVLTLMQSESLALEFPNEAHIVQLSGYALVMECGHEMREGDFLEFLVMLEEYPLRIVSVLAQVEHKTPAIILPGIHSHSYSLNFIKIEEDDREAVIRFVFSEERKRIRQQRGDM